MPTTGSCLCGAVRYTVNGKLRDVIGCHCTQCRKQTGHYVAATAAEKAELDVQGQDALTWFSASPGYRRGFCATCGSLLFWEDLSSEQTSIMAGTLDGPSGVTLTSHIFVADKGDYYELGDDVPKHEGYPASDR